MLISKIENLKIQNQINPDPLFLPNIIPNLNLNLNDIISKLKEENLDLKNKLNQKILD